MKSKHVFITGVAGFVGAYLADELMASGFTVTGSVFKEDSKDARKRVSKDVKLVELDILDAQKVARTLKRINPDYICHLAAFSSVGRSFSHERLTYDINFTGTLNMLEAAAELQKLKKFLFTSSSDCYGIFSPITKTLKETDPLNPVSPYGISKVAGEHLCQLYFNRYGVPVVISRSFNHSGPGQSESFVIPSFCKQIVKIERGEQKPVMNVGDLSVKRDLSDVRDIVSGYRLMLDKAKPGAVIQLCSGKSIAIKTVLDKLIKLSKTKISVKIDKKIFRKNDIPIIKGSNAKAKREIGYKPKYKIDKTLSDSLHYWRENG